MLHDDVATVLARTDYDAVARGFGAEGLCVTRADEVVPALRKEFGYRNVMAIPKIEKVVINMGVGEGRENAKVLDFGVATHARATAPRSPGPAPTSEGTATGAIPGTPQYMAPEQVAGQAVDHRADIWAFGLVLQLNLLTVKLSVIALLLAIIYPFLKRVFWLPQAWLGVAFGFGVPMAFAAHRDVVVPIAWVILLANVFWAIAYDTQYAMVDRDDDIKLGLKSSAILFGRHDVTAVLACYLLFIGMMIYIGYWARMGACYFFSLIVTCLLVAVEYPMFRSRQRDRCFKAFLFNNWIGAAIFAGIVADFVWYLQLFGGVPR